jgi:hypothetical protein
MNKKKSAFCRHLVAFLAASVLAEGAPSEDIRAHIPANPSKESVAKHRFVSSWTRAIFELEHGYTIRVEREREKVTKIEVAKDSRLFVVPTEFYAVAAYVDFTRARVTRTDDPEDIPRVVTQVYASVDTRAFGEAEFYLSLSFRDKTELESEGVRFMAFSGSSVLVMYRGLGDPIELDKDLPRGPGAVTIASHQVDQPEPNQTSQRNAMSELFFVVESRSSRG